MLRPTHIILIKIVLERYNIISIFQKQTQRLVSLGICPWYPHQKVSGEAEIGRQIGLLNSAALPVIFHWVIK